MVETAHDRDATHTDGAVSSSEEDILHSSYDAAIEPHRLPDLLGPWERFFIPAWYKSPFSRRDTLEKSGLITHLRHIERIAKLSVGRARPRAEEEVLKQYRRAAAFTVNKALCVSAANAATRQVFGLTVNQHLQTLPIRDEDRDYLAKVAMTMLHAGPDLRPEPTRIVRARRLADEGQVLFLIYLIEPDDTDAFILVTTTELHWPEASTSVLRVAYGLTRAEAEIMIALTRYPSIKEIAESRGRSVATVRAQIKTIMTKTEARNQQDLLRIALTLMDIVPQEADRISSEAPANCQDKRRDGGVLSDLPFKSITRPDGRRFDYLEFGPANGRPVMYAGSDFGLCRWPADAERAAIRLGMRVITPVRPGYGSSTPLTAEDDRVETFARDMIALMDHLKIADATFLVTDADLVYVARLARHWPERVRAVLGISSTLPLTRPEQYERMGRWHRFILGTARYTPQVLPFIVRISFAMARQIGKPEFVRLVYGASPADVALSRDPTLFEALDFGSDIVLAEGFDAAKAYAQEITIVHRTDWRPEFEAMCRRIPVVVMIGEEDQAVAAETFEEFQNDYPGVEMIRIPEAGSFLFFQHWNIVVDRLDLMTRN